MDLPRNPPCKDCSPYIARLYVMIKHILYTFPTWRAGELASLQMLKEDLGTGSA